MSALGPSKRRYIDKYSYSPSSLLGQGYSGTVHLGKQETSGKPYAIKIIEKNILKYQAHKSMILCEIQFLTLLRGSQKILTLYDVFNTKNNIYLVLQLCNTDLNQYIRAKKCLTEPEAIDIMKNIIAGYKAIWKAKIVHRDLKPSNILLQEEDIKIADFGFSMYEKDQKEYQKINVGSPYYMPFQVLIHNKYSYQSDIWAIGIIYYEMITGKRPWKAKTQRKLYEEMKNFDIAKIMPKNISQKSVEFLSKTLALDLKHRMKPQELVCFKFDDLSLALDESLRVSCRSQEAKSLQKQKIIDKIIHKPENVTKIQEEKEENQQAVNELESIQKTNQEKNELANSRMKKQGLQKNQQTMKKFSKILRSQIHFCRYVFKLLLKVIQQIPDELNLIRPELKQQMAAFVFCKLRKIETEKITDASIYQQWLQTKECDKIKTVINQYRNKYRVSLKQINIPNQLDYELYKKLLKKGILKLYKRAYDAYIAEQDRQEKQLNTKPKRPESQKSSQREQDDESLIMQRKEEILLLDYFITLKQLNRLEEKYGWEVFEEKSKIESILEGQPLKYIQKKHILAISSKLQNLKIL